MPRPLRQEPCLSKCDWAPTGETRDVAVRLHPDDRVEAANIERAEDHHQHRHGKSI